jgi:hypothetical protein
MEWNLTRYRHPPATPRAAVEGRARFDPRNTKRHEPSTPDNRLSRCVPFRSIVVGGTYETGGTGAAAGDVSPRCEVKNGRRPCDFFHNPPATHISPISANLIEKLGMIRYHDWALTWIGLGKGGTETMSTCFIQECPTCGRSLQVSVEFLGRQVVCRHCSGRFEATDSSNAAPVGSNSGIDLLRRAEELLESASPPGSRGVV